MKVVCINNNAAPIGVKVTQNFRLRLTVGRWYDVVGGSKLAGNYIIINDWGDKTSYSIKNFRTVDEIREEKLNTILG